MKVRWISFILMSFVLLGCKLILFPCFPWLEIYGCRPDLLIVLSGYVALLGPPQEAFIAGWFLGLLYDLTSCERFGFFCVLFCFTNLVIARLQKGILAEHLSIFVLVVFFLALQCNLVHAFMLYWWYEIDLFSKALFTALYTAFFSPFLIIIFKKMQIVK